MNLPAGGSHSRRSSMRVAFAATLLALLAIGVATTAASGAREKRSTSLREPGARDFDVRGERGPAVTGAPRFATGHGGLLTGRQRGSADDIALRFVRQHADAFGLDPGDLAGLRLVHRYTTPRGLTRLDWAQAYKGIPAFDTGLRATVKAGRLVSVSGPLQPDLRVPSTTPRLSANEAMRRSFAGVGIQGEVRSSGSAGGAKRRTRLSSGYAELTLFPERKRTRLAWKLYAFADSQHVYLTVIDAQSGELLKRANVVKNARGLAHRYFPGSGGAGGTDALQTFATSPDPWLTNPSVLIGDNAHVYSDQDDKLGDACNFACSPGAGDEIGPSSGSDWNYSPGHSIGSADPNRPCPAAGCTWNGFNTPDNWTINRNQAGTQLFWFVNNFHDYLQGDGGIQFNDASGNFEADGPGGDRLQAQVDDGANTGSGSRTGFPDCNHVNNANMLTLPQGLPGPQMQMFLWTAFCGDSGLRDVNGADDATIVYHEYSHGLSSRLVDPSDTGGLNRAQSGAMGEAWSDWYALDYLVGQGLDVDTAAPGELLLGTYEAPFTGPVRTKPIDVPVSSGGYTYGDFGHVGFGPEVHDDGEIWGQTLWDLRRSLVGHYGLSTGEHHVRALVTDGMRIGPASPSFLDMRNAILAADTAGKLGDCDRIWAVFAARGMGSGAQTAGPGDTTPVENFTNPSASACHHAAAAAQPPTPTAPAKASFKKSKRTIRVSRTGRFSFTFTAGAGLKGRITLKTVRKVRPSKRGRKRRATFANKAFRVPSSGRVKIKFKLSRRNRRILKRYKRLRIKVTVKLRNSANLTSTASVRITLKAPKRRRR